MTTANDDVSARVEVAAPCGRLVGKRSGSAAVFAGIPFAQAPLGDLRFAAPQVAPPWTGSLDALAFPPAPAQQADFIDTSEDCLFLNVWTPSLDESLPVVVWVYGGGFEGGSASPPLTDGAALAQRLHAVVVAANYRVGALGFLHTELGSNIGLLDVIGALEWVRESISSFGGDPDAVTLMGQSAGAFIIGALLAAPAAKGLFHRAILQSGSTGRVFPLDTALSIRDALLAMCGTRSLTELQGRDVSEIIKAQSAVIDQDIGQRNLPGGRSWGTVLDGKLLPQHPQTVVEQGGAVDIPLLISSTRDEVRFWEVQAADFTPADESGLLAEMVRAEVDAPSELLAGYKAEMPDASLARLRSNFLSDYIYRWPARELARAQAACGGTAYLAEFTAMPLGQTLGACHGSDLLYLFGAVGPFSAPDTPENRALSADVAASWRAFVHTGAADWSPAEANDVLRHSREFGTTRIG